jgi:hypothetical protein
MDLAGSSQLEERKDEWIPDQIARFDVMLKRYKVAFGRFQGGLFPKKPFSLQRIYFL